ncbi:hypothetical protein J2W89_003920 [Pseudarthrobacter oxydans]|nr:hypothetical protein [Pseudarthrobacter oxydans]
MGVVDRVNDSAVTHQWAEGTVGGKVTIDTIGVLLLGVFGTVTTGAASGGIYPHTFSVKQSSIPTTLTMARSTPLSAERFAYATVDTFELTAEAGGYVQVSSAIKARVGVSSTETVAFTTEEEFTSKDIELKTAANTGALTGASAVNASSMKLSIERPSNAFVPLGTNNQPQFDRGNFEAKGEFVVRLTDTQLEADYLANTKKALSITLANGTKSLTFTASKVRYRELERSAGLDDVVTATVQFYCEFDTATSKSIDAVLKNTRTGYIAA